MQDSEKRDCVVNLTWAGVLLSLIIFIFSTVMYCNNKDSETKVEAFKNGYEQQITSSNGYGPYTIMILGPLPVKCTIGQRW